MKLYTEEQVRKIIGKAQLLNWDDEFSFSEDYLISSETPIELPTDEEIEMAAPYVSRDAHDYYVGDRDGFIHGAKWMRDKIQGSKP